jgi:hypothetical protein
MLSLKSVTGKINAVAVAIITFLVAYPEVRHDLMEHVPVAYQGVAALLFGVLVHYAAERDRAAPPPEVG